MANKHSVFVAAVIAAGLALAPFAAASAQESESTKAPVHHMDPEAGATGARTMAPAPVAGMVMIEQNAPSVKAPVHNLSPQQ